MDVASPATGARGSVSLDSAPPRPDNFMTAQPPSPSGLGDMARSPQLMTMQGLAMVKDGFQLLSNGVPALAQLLTNTLTDLEKMVVSGMADSMSGAQQVAPPGVAPMMSPPPGATPPGMAGVPGMAGAGGPPTMGAA
jgi:hypothetical protein